MALSYERNEIDIERTGSSTNVPNNDVAHLMYYLHCVCTTINCNHDPDIQRFTNYRNWSYLSIEEQKALLVVCYRFSPDVFDDKVFFHSDALCGSSSNEFYTINQVRSRLVAVESIVIAGRARQVNQIMTYTLSWMQTYYFDPMRRLAARYTQQPAIRHTPTYRSSLIREPTRNSTSRGRILLYICCGIYCIVFVIPTIIIIIIGIANSGNK